MDNLPWILRQPRDCDTVSFESVQGKNVFRKQVIYEGTFSKGTLKFKVDRALLRHWATTGNLMLSKGVSIPMPNTHEDTPEDKRADVIKFELGVDSKGRNALFIHYDFVPELSDDVKAALKGSDVSIFSPPEYSVAGDKYEWPIKHVAFTSYPVVNDLDKTQAIAASLEETKTMDLKAFAKLFGLELTDEMLQDEAVLKKAVEDFLATLKKPAQPAEPPVEAAVPKPAPVAASNVLIDLVTRNRAHQIQDLAREGKITPAQVKSLTDSYCSKENAALAFSVDTGTLNDGFESVIQVLSSNTLLKLGEQSGQQSPSGTAGGDGKTAMQNAVNRTRKSQGLEPITFS